MRVVVYAPMGRDAHVLGTLMEALQLDTLVCRSAAEFQGALDEQALLAVATEEGLAQCLGDRLAEQLARQPPWSDLPVIALADQNALLPGSATRALAQLGNVTLISRPLRREVLLLAVLSAQRTRLLQLQVRDQIGQLNAYAAELERRVDERTRALATEVRERRQVEASLAESRRLESLGRLTGGVAHDFNNVLQVISGATELMRVLDQEQGRLRRPLDGVARAVEQGSRLTQQLLSFARRQPMQIASVQLGEHLAEMAQLLRHSLGKHIALHLAVADGLWPVRTDLAQLEMALLNLVINARDAMPEGGAVTLAARNVALPQDGPEELAELHGDFVLVELNDEGAGMPAQVAAKAFEPFFTTKAPGKGTGLGLSQVYGYAQQSGGTAFIRSGSSGTTVTLALPRGTGPGMEAAAPPPPAPDAEARFAGLRVLCVEDDDSVAEVAHDLFVSLGCWVCLACSADEAILSDFAGIDLVFSDVRMPGTMDGIDLAHWLARTHPATPVVLASGFIGDPGRLDGLDVQFLRKPYTRQSVLKAAAAALVRSAGSGERQ
ncbi:response regulator [Massilia arenosa]|uniref:histidine kinase n=1 Tax=Zemynaea arenosa TaxID=2561931 RepID=A0A4Y9SA54_9BURK|nr:response regulator [Massilia arenosa]TFW18753.1 response regulator [Massilia arenosa]